MLPPPLDILRRSLKLAGEDDLESAVALLQEGIVLCETEAEHLYHLPRLTSSLGLFHRRRGRRDEAIAAVRRALLLLPDDRSLLHFLADLLLEEGDVSGAALAAVDLRAVCERDPATFTADWVEAVVLLEKRITA
jgi:Flp pilus assembly protein TadD